MSVELKDRLAEIDPSTLEAGPELDALVAKCLGLSKDTTDGLNPDNLESFYTILRGHVFIYTPKYNGYFDPSTNDGLAFSVLWPWLLEKNGPLCLKPYRGIPAVIENVPRGKTVSEGPFWALALCRAVVAVAKEKNRADHDRKGDWK